MNSAAHNYSIMIVIITFLIFQGCTAFNKNTSTDNDIPVWASDLKINSYSEKNSILVYSPDRSSGNESNKKVLNKNETEKIPLQEQLSYEKLIKEKKLVVMLKTLFDFGEYKIKNEYHVHLKGIAEFMQKYPNTETVIDGYTCTLGSDKLNMNLSSKRADAVRAFLIETYNIKASRLKTLAFGSKNPVGDNLTIAGRKQNRRVTAIITTRISETIRQKKPNTRLLFDYLNKPLKNLTDYSSPRKKIKTLKRRKKTVKAKNSPWLEDDLRKILKTDRGVRAGNENVNIIVNKSDETSQNVPTASAIETLSRIEKRYNKYGELTKGKKISQFGYNLIRHIQISGIMQKGIGEDLIRKKKGTPLFSQNEATRLFSHSREGSASYYSNEYSSMRPVSSEYIIAPGDEVFIKITGPVEIAEVFAVDRNGHLFIPKIGTVNLAGRKASELQAIISAKAKEIFNHAFVEASLGRLRTIQVTITGNIKNPGLIHVAANSSLLNALATAGGPNKNGTLRNIKLRRRNKVETTIDLYGVLIEGDWNQDPALLPDDIIYIGPVGDTAAVLSPGDDGAIYEIRETSTLESLTDRIGVSGSFTDMETVLVERSTASTDREIRSLELKKEAGSFRLKDGDIFQFFSTHPFSYNSVAIIGPVLRPGAYPFHDKMKISDLLTLSRGFLTSASLDKALLIREIGDETFFDIMPDDKRGMHRKQLIWLDLSEILAGDRVSDLELSRLDRLKIFTINDRQPLPTIRIIGGVRKPGEYHLAAGMTLGDLMAIAGGPSEKAFAGESSIVRRRHSIDGKRHFDVEIIPFNLADVISQKKTAEILLNNNDKIVIRQVNNLEVSAKIDGWVQFPGTYILPSGSRIEDLIRLAGGVLKGADLRASVFKRQRIANLANRHLKGFYASSTEHFARVRDKVTLTGHPSESFANQLSLAGQNRIYSNMGRFQTTGRVVVDMTTKNFPDTDDNLVIEDGDTLNIPQKMTTIMVMGRIFNPSAYLWKKGLAVSDYLDKTGGLLEDADPKQIYVVMANGEVKSAAQKGGKAKLLSIIPNPGDIVFVPQKPLGRSKMAQVMDTLQLLRMVAGTVATGAAIPNMFDATPTVELNTGIYEQRNINEELKPELYDMYTREQ